MHSAYIHMHSGEDSGGCGEEEAKERWVALSFLYGLYVRTEDYKN